MIRGVRTTGGEHGNDIVLYVQHDGEANEPFLCGGILLALVDLFPKREVVIRAAMHACLKRNTRCPVEHQVGYLRRRSRRLSKLSLSLLRYGAVLTMR